MISIWAFVGLVLLFLGVVLLLYIANTLFFLLKSRDKYLPTYLRGIPFIVLDVALLVGAIISLKES